MRTKLAQKFCDAVRLSSKIREKAKQIKLSGELERENLRRWRAKANYKDFPRIDIEFEPVESESPARMTTPKNASVRKVKQHRRSFSHEIAGYPQ